MRKCLLLFALPILVGCTPESVVWSPDGQTLAVATAKGVYLADKQRNASEPIAVRPWSLTPIAWLPTGQGIFVVHQRPAANWGEIEKLLGPEKTSQAKELARQIVETADTAPETAWSQLDLPGGHSWPVLVGAWGWLKETQPETLKSAMKGDEFGNSPDWEKVKAYVPKINVLSHYRVDGMQTKHVADLYESLENIWSVRVSPDGQWLSMVTGASKQTANEAVPMDNNNEAGADLYVLRVDQPKGRRRIEQTTGLWTTWSADSQSLYFFDLLGNSGEHLLGTLCRWSFDRNTPGELPATEVPPDRLHDVVLTPFTKIHLLSNGQLLFASQILSLPASATQQPKETALFLVDPSLPNQITKISLQQAEETVNAIMIGSYGVSPSGTHLAFTTKSGKTGRMDIRQGTIDWVDPGPPESKEGVPAGVPSLVAPAWTTDDEFAFLSAPQSRLTKSAKPQLMLSGPNRQINLSQTWEWFEVLK